MNTQCGTIGTAAPRSTRPAHACPAHRGRSPAVEGHHTDRRSLQESQRHCGRYATTHVRAHAAQAQQRPPADGKTTPHSWDRLTSPETPTMGVTPAAKGRAISRDDPGQADLTQESPPYNPTMNDHATHCADACRSDAPARVAHGLPDLCSGHPKMRPSLGSPTTRAIEHNEAGSLGFPLMAQADKPSLMILLAH